MPKVSIPSEVVENKIYLIRRKRVMTDYDLAQLYGVPTFVLNQAVKRNKNRFPVDFMFQLNQVENDFLISHYVISKKEKRGGRRTLPYVFTQEGVAMLSSVLRSQRAVDVNIAIMRAFVKLRELMMTHQDLTKRLDELERKYENQDERIMAIFEAIRQLMAPIQEPKKGKIGFYKE